MYLTLLGGGVATAGGTVATAGPAQEELEMLRVQLRLAEETAQRVQREVLATSNNTFDLLTPLWCCLIYPMPSPSIVRWRKGGAP